MNIKFVLLSGSILFGEGTGEDLLSYGAGGLASFSTAKVLVNNMNRLKLLDKAGVSFVYNGLKNKILIYGKDAGKINLFGNTPTWMNPETFLKKTTQWSDDLFGYSKQTVKIGEDIGSNLGSTNIFKAATNVSKPSLISKLGGKLGLLGIGIDVGIGIHENIKSDADLVEFGTDVVVDGLIAAGTAYAAGAVTTAAGAFIAGTVIGAAAPAIAVGAAAVALGFATTLLIGGLLKINVGDKTIKNHIKDGFNNFVDWIFSKK